MIRPILLLQLEEKWRRTATDRIKKKRGGASVLLFFRFSGWDPNFAPVTEIEVLVYPSILIYDSLNFDTPLRRKERKNIAESAVKRQKKLHQFLSFFGLLVEIRASLQLQKSRYWSRWAFRHMICPILQLRHHRRNPNEHDRLGKFKTKVKYLVILCIYLF